MRKPNRSRAARLYEAANRPMDNALTKPLSPKTTRVLIGLLAVGVLAGLIGYAGWSDGLKGAGILLLLLVVGALRPRRSVTFKAFQQEKDRS